MALPSSLEFTESEGAAIRAWYTPLWRWMAYPTVDLESYVGPLIALQVAFVVCVGFIFTAGFLDPGTDRQLLYAWLGESVANLVIRVLLLAQMRRRSVSDFLANPKWRFLPLATGIIHGSHWAWTATLFVTPELDTVTLVTLFAFVVMSIACMISLPASPGASVIIVTLTWVTTVIQLWSVPSVQGVTVTVALLLVIGTILLMSFTLGAVHVRGYMSRSDDVMRLLDEFWAANAELQRMRTQAAAELQSRSQFFSGASHDFAQRLHALKLLGRAAVEESQTSGTALRKLSDALEDLEVYVRDVLEFARMEGSMLAPSLRPIGLQEVFQTLLLHFESIADARGVDLKIRTTPAVIETDQAMLLRVLENLVSNAIKFTRARVLVAARRRGEGWMIQVWDQGPGIPSGNEAAIFGAFYQHQVYLDRRREGVGLGLAIVERLAASLQCSVSVRSREGRGTVMTISGLRSSNQ